MTGELQADFGRSSYFLAEQRNQTTPWIVISIVLHGALFGYAWWETHREHDTARLEYKEAIMVQSVRWAPEERPKHWMPRLAPTESEAAPETKAIKVAPNPTVKETPKKKEKPKKSEKTSKQKRKERQQRMAKALERVKNKYNSWDGSPNGTKDGLSPRAVQILGSVYAGQLRDVFRSKWSVPKVISKDELKKLKCKILVKIDQTGRITAHELKEGSGNIQFDSTAVRAVKMTPVVPLPDDMLKSLVFREGILINFTWKE